MYDDVRETPPAVVGAVSVGTAPLPFLAVYAVLFILHGWLTPVHPPDITSSQTGELIAGIIAAVVFVALAVTLWMFLNGRRRWPFAIGQLAVLATTIVFLTSDTTGGAVVSVVVGLACLVSLGLAFAPEGWTHVDRPVPGFVRAVYGPRTRASTTADPADESALPQSGIPSEAEPGTLRRRRSRTG
jgi:hypothetical protein